MAYTCYLDSKSADRKLLKEGGFGYFFAIF